MNLKRLICFGITILLSGVSGFVIQNTKTDLNQASIAKKVSKAVNREEIEHLMSPCYEVTGGSYYDKVNNNLTKANLLNSLNKVVASHTDVGYDGLYEVYLDSDVRPDGTIWDFYGDFFFKPSNKAGSYKKEGDCYNREHIVAQSWFGNGTPKSDAFHVVPTDGYINNRRGNEPFGEVSTPTYSYTVKNSALTGISGTNKLGPCTYPGYTGKVFEPLDCYKGDFARSMMYFAVVYKSKGSGGTGAVMFSSNESDCYLTTYGKNLLLDWHHRDPVSYKEKARNDAIYQHQHNRNPFIDNPSYADAIWGNGTVSGSKTLQNLTISGKLNKSIYRIGEQFNASGLTFTASYTEEGGTTSTEDVTSQVKANVTTINDFINYVTFSYTYNAVTKTVNVPITVIALDDLEIEGSLVKDKYIAGEKFDPTGLKVNAIYSDNSKVEVTNKVTWSPTTIDENTQIITATYKEGSITRETTVDIEIIYPIDAELSGELNKKLYSPGERFNPAGLVVTAIFEDNQTRDVTSLVTWSPSIISEDTVEVTGTFTSGNFSKSFVVTDFSLISIIDIEVEGSPDFTEYYEGEQFNPQGLSVYAIYNNRERYDVSDEVTYSPQYLSLDTTSVRGHYLDFTFEVDGIVVRSLEFEYVEYCLADETLCKTHYIGGEIFNPKGLKVIGYTNLEHEIDITDECVWPKDPLVVGQTSIEGFYKYADEFGDEARLYVEIGIEVAEIPYDPSSGDEDPEVDPSPLDPEGKQNNSLPPAAIAAIVGGGAAVIIGAIIILIVAIKKKH